VVGNSALFGGGVEAVDANNCIVYYNSSQNSFVSTINFSCTMPPAYASGNITNEPSFVDTNGWADLRLRSDSPCINSGRNAYAPAKTRNPAK